MYYLIINDMTAVVAAPCGDKLFSGGHKIADRATLNHSSYLSRHHSCRAFNCLPWSVPHKPALCCLCYGINPPPHCLPLQLHLLLGYESLKLLLLSLPLLCHWLQQVPCTNCLKDRMIIAVIMCFSSVQLVWVQGEMSTKSNLQDKWFYFKPVFLPRGRLSILYYMFVTCK